MTLHGYKLKAKMYLQLERFWEEESKKRENSYNEMNMKKRMKTAMSLKEYYLGKILEIRNAQKKKVIKKEQTEPKGANK